MSITPDGKRAVSTGNYHLKSVLLVWDLERGICLSTADTFTCCSIFPDGKHVASAGIDSFIRIWQWENIKCLKAVQGHADRIVSLCVSKDSKTIISGSKDKTLRVWGLDNNWNYRELEKQGFVFKRIHITPDGTRCIASGTTWKYSPFMWDMENYGLLKTLDGHTDYVNDIELSSDGKLLASASSDRSIRIWNIEDSSRFNTLTGHSNSAIKVNFTVYSHYVVSIDGYPYERSTLRVWKFENQECFRSIQCNLYGLSPDGYRIATNGIGNTIQIWDLYSGESYVSLEGLGYKPSSFCFTPDGKYFIFSGNDDRTLRICDVSSGECIAVYQANNSFSDMDITASGLIWSVKQICRM